MQHIELVRKQVERRYCVRRDGKYSITMPEAAASEIAERIPRRRLVTEQPWSSLSFDSTDFRVVPIE